LYGSYAKIFGVKKARELNGKQIVIL
jgi:hypothetical protein